MPPPRPHTWTMKPTSWFLVTMGLVTLALAFAVALSTWQMMLGAPNPADAATRAVGMGLGPWILALTITLACVAAAMLFVRRAER